MAPNVEYRPDEVERQRKVGDAIILERAERVVARRFGSAEGAHDTSTALLDWASALRSEAEHA